MKRKTTKLPIGSIEIPGYEDFFLTPKNKIYGPSCKTLKMLVSNQGYLSFSTRPFRGCGYVTCLPLHRAIALVRVPGYFEGAHVDHKDGNRLNNRVTNLRWVTQSENTLSFYKKRKKLREKLKKSPRKR